MASDLIDRAALLDIVENKYRDVVAGRYPFNIVAYDLSEIIKKQPTVDAAPVVHGECKTIEKCSEWYEPERICSICDRAFMADEPNYCPYCGAKLDGGDK